MTKLFIFFFSIILFSSCTKNISSSDARNFSIDTLFKTNLGMQAFHMPLYGENHAVTDDGFIYLALSEEVTSGDSRTKIVKVNLSTGEISWTFDQFLPTDMGLPQKLSFRNGRILASAFKNAYVLDASTGNPALIFNSPDTAYFTSSALGTDELFITFHNQEHGSWLQKIEIQSGAVQTLKHLPISQPHSPVEVHSLVYDQNDYIFWQVLESTGVYPPVKFIYGHGPDYQNYEHLSLGTGSGRVAFDTWVFSDNLSGNLVTVGSSGLIQAHNLNTAAPLRWIYQLPRPHNFRYFMYNSKYIYISTSSYGNRHMMLDIATGDAREPGITGEVKAVSDELLLSTNGKFLNIFEPESWELMQEFEAPFGVHRMFHVGNNEFFFFGFSNNEQAWVGSIRITPLQP